MIDIKSLRVWDKPGTKKCLISRRNENVIRTLHFLAILDDFDNTHHSGENGSVSQVYQVNGSTWHKFPEASDCGTEGHGF